MKSIYVRHFLGCRPLYSSSDHLSALSLLCPCANLSAFLPEWLQAAVQVLDSTLALARLLSWASKVIVDQTTLVDPGDLGS